MQVGYRKIEKMGDSFFREDICHGGGEIFVTLLVAAAIATTHQRSSAGSTKFSR